MSVKEKVLPYFPLNISLLPGEDIPLRIFEPRYKQLIKECEENEISFGIPYSKDGKVQDFGVECKLKQVVATNSNGEMVIVVEGIAIFEILSLQDPMPDKLYSGGRIALLDIDQEVKNAELMKILIHYTDTMDPEFLKNVKGNSILITDVARALNLSSEDKFKFISLNNQPKQELFLIAQLQYLSKLREQENLLKNDYFLN
ncbi:MAG: LON peptidase substrate-binding domain-containing protein [Bacteroidales bacterium]|nr:LON peptidase substrate-binding domain-containing protein [Bacteroidales bacterium]MCB9013856.1 LON peptidase substrate-binding domain-containing protein [Bacteroidales bacterium]